MTDAELDALVARLTDTRRIQFTVRAIDDDDPAPPIYVNPDGPEAAAALTTLRKQRDELREAVGVMADALDEADNIIAINCGTDTPKEWDRAYRRAAKARQALSNTKGEE